MPDLDLQTAGGPTRVRELLHRARPVLLARPSAGDPGDSGVVAGVDQAADGMPTGNEVGVVRAGFDDRWELSVIGEVVAPAAVLVRPDGHVAWAGDFGDIDDPRDPGLDRALETWLAGTSV
jgi:3-(3-hydroxy-phenyl)propionate hydroxylase